MLVILLEDPLRGRMAFVYNLTITNVVGAIETELLTFPLITISVSVKHKNLL